MSRIPHLCDDYVDDQLSEPVYQALLDDLKNDPEKLAEARESLGMHGMLQALQIDDADCDQLLLRVERVIGVDLQPIQFEDAVLATIANHRRKRTWIISLFGIAAAIAIYFSVANKPSKPTSTPIVHYGIDLPIVDLEAPSVPVPVTFVEAPSGLGVGTLSEVSGTLWLFSPDEEKTPAADGTIVPSGSTIVCDLNGSSTLELNDGSVFAMAPKTELTVRQSDGRYELFLGKGHVNATINPQAKDKALRCTTNNAELEVLGTRFSMNSSYLYTQNKEAKDSVTQVIVQQGEIRFSNLTGFSIDVGANESATVFQELPPTQTAIGDLRSDDLEIARATYGSSETTVDVTEAIRARTVDHRLLLTGLFNDLQGDPHDTESKKLRVEYLINGERKTAVFGEWIDFEKRPATTITLPQGKDQREQGREK